MDSLPHGRDKTIYDGDGRPVKQVELTESWTLQGGWSGWNEMAGYYLYSSVTGQKITQLDFNGGHAQTFVNMGGTVIAQRDSSDATFHVTDPVTGSVQMVNQDGDGRRRVSSMKFRVKSSARASLTPL